MKLLIIEFNAKISQWPVTEPVSTTVNSREYMLFLSLSHYNSCCEQFAATAWNSSLHLSFLVFHIKSNLLNLTAVQQLWKSRCTCFLLSPSVEHDFRQQEGRLQCVMEALDGEYDVPAPTLAKAPPATPPAYRPTTKGRVKKLRKKCFWWL